MADLFGALAQVSPAATTLTDAYTVPTARRATVIVSACNRASDTVVRIQHAPGGAASAVAQYLLYDYPLLANDTQTTARLSAAVGDVIRVYSGSGSVTFNINGIEEDA
jgi:hypothetical protein